VTSITLTTVKKPSEIDEIVDWLESLLIVDGVVAYRLTGPTWGDPIIFERPEDAVAFTLRFRI
jgi:hypothetical protein